MKSIVKFEKAINDKGAVAGGELLVENGFLIARAEAKAPLTEVVDPVLNIVNKAIDKLEAAIPGDWDKGILEKVKQEIKEEADKFVAGI